LSCASRVSNARAAQHDPAAHGHRLQVFEQELMSGIAGQIRNQVTIFLSTRDEVGDFYPRIELVSDEFGNELQPPPGVTQEAGVSGTKDTGLAVHVGDTVTFMCTGTDPQGRRLTWRLSVGGLGNVVAEVHSASGEVAELTWIADDRQVREHQEVTVWMLSSGQHHRYGSWDQLVAYWYNVRPRNSQVVVCEAGQGQRGCPVSIRLAHNHFLTCVGSG
jgi:hypothetical protein